jgi:hypothetical protein
MEEADLNNDRKLDYKEVNFLFNLYMLLHNVLAEKDAYSKILHSIFSPNKKQFF